MRFCSTVDSGALEGGSRVSTVRSHSERSPKAACGKKTKCSGHTTSSERPECRLHLSQADTPALATGAGKHVCPLKGERHYKIRTHSTGQYPSFSNLDNASGVTSVDWAIPSALPDLDRFIPQSILRLFWRERLGKMDSTSYSQRR